MSVTDKSKISADWVSRDGFPFWTNGKPKFDRFWHRGGMFRRNWIEISHGLGFGLSITDQEDRRLLHCHLIWPNVFLRLCRVDERPFETSYQYGFDVSRSGLVLSWRKHRKYIDYPWGKRFVRMETLLEDGSWAEGHVSDHEDECWQTVCDWFYRSRVCDLQEGDALIRVSRRITSGKILRWRRKKDVAIEVQFDREVGSEAGSWKGGVTGCGYSMQPDELPTDTFKRMMRERSFDRR